MKPTKLIATAIGMLTSVSFGFAQSSASASASASIVTPISITKNVDMAFGNVAVQPSTAGTVILSAAGARSTTGGVTLPVTAGTFAAASFTVNGETGYTYAVTLPTSVSLNDGASHVMTVDNFSSSTGSVGTLTGGTQTLNIGARLNVSAAQVPGSYSTATPFNITVNYN